MNIRAMCCRRISISNEEGDSGSDLDVSVDDLDSESDVTSKEVSDEDEKG